MTLIGEGNTRFYISVDFTYCVRAQAINGTGTQTWLRFCRCKYEEEARKYIDQQKYEGYSQGFWYRLETVQPIWIKKEPTAESLPLRPLLSINPEGWTLIAPINKSEVPVQPEPIQQKPRGSQGPPKRKVRI